MVIVDIRPDGERGSGKGAIPTDAYFAVEEIKDVNTNYPFSLSLSLNDSLTHFPTPLDLTNRMVQLLKTLSYTYLL